MSTPSVHRARLLLACLALPAVLLASEVVFRCPSCAAEHLAACPEVTGACDGDAGEIVREPVCGCCPVCARRAGEHCGVYQPRCATGLRCHPAADGELPPLQQLIHGLGRCGPRVEEEEEETGQDGQATNEVHGTEETPQKRPHRIRPKESARKQHQNDLKSKMKTTQPEEPRPPRVSQSSCQQELSRVLEEISRMTLQDNRGPLENLYQLRFPNCDRNGLYNHKQCNMSTHGQRGECWCVDPTTGVQLPATPRVRGDPNCDVFQEDFGSTPTAAAFR